MPVLRRPRQGSADYVHAGRCAARAASSGVKSYHIYSSDQIVNNGIVPDIIVEQKEYTTPSEAAAEAIFEHLGEEDFQKAMEEDIKPYDHQLSTAINVIKGIVVYRSKDVDG